MITKNLATHYGGEYMAKSLMEILTMPLGKKDDRDAQEIITDLADKMGLEVI